MLCSPKMNSMQWKNISIRFQLSILYSLLLVTLLSLFSFGVFVNTKNFLINNTAVRLKAQAKPVIQQWLYLNREIKHEIDAGYLKEKAHLLAVDLTSRDTAALVLDKHGSILATGRQLKEEPVPVPPNRSYYEKSLSGNNDVSYTERNNGHLFLVVLIPLRKAPGSPAVLGVLQLSTSLSSIENILIRQKTILIAGIILVFIAGALLGLWITTTSLKELRIMASACNEISMGDFEKRIKIPKRNDEIGRLADAFNYMIGRIKDLFDAQSRFVVNAAHELRTPLTAIQGSLEVLMRGAQDDPQAISRLTQGMYREVTRLTRMCEQLLDLSRIKNSENARRERINIKKYLEDFAQYAGIIAEGRKLTVTGEPDLYISADPDSIKQVLFNLTDNAIQHTGREGIIIFDCKSSGDKVKISISDNGSGISSEDIPHIFEPFYRGDPSRSRRRGGTGLGLTIVKTIVEANSGKIEVISKPDEKTVFTITFPLS